MRREVDWYAIFEKEVDAQQTQLVLHTESGVKSCRDHEIIPSMCMQIYVYVYLYTCVCICKIDIWIYVPASQFPNVTLHSSFRTCEFRIEALRSVSAVQETTV